MLMMESAKVISNTDQPMVLARLQALSWNAAAYSQVPGVSPVNESALF